MCVCVCVCSVVQSCPTLCDLMDCNPPGSSVGGISQARILEWTPIHFSRESFRPKDLMCASCAGRRVLTTKPLQKLRVWTHHTFLTPSPVDGHYLLTASLGQLWIMLPSRFVYKSLCGQVLFFLECYPEVELNEGCKCVLNFIRHCESILQGGCANIHSHLQGMSIHVSPYSCQCLLASLFKNFNHSSLYVTGFHSQLNLHFP